VGPLFGGVALEPTRSGLWWKCQPQWALNRFQLEGVEAGFQARLRGDAGVEAGAIGNPDEQRRVGH